MSTMQRLQLDRQAHDACALLANAQYQLLVIRERQLAEADREAALFREDAMLAEAKADRTWDRIDEIVKTHGLGDHGTPLEQLERLGAMLALRNQALDEVSELFAKTQAALDEERAEHAATKATFHEFRLVRLANLGAVDP